MTKAKFITLISIFILGTSSLSFGQTLNDAAEKYNAAASLMNTDLKAAYATMEEVLDMCNKIGDEAKDLKENVIKVLPGWQYNIANGYVKEKDYPNAITAFEKVVEVATEYGDAGLVDKAKVQLSKLLYVEANSLFKENKSDEALEKVNEILKYDAEFSRAYLLKGQIYSKKGDAEQMRQAYVQAKELAEKSNEETVVGNANTLLSGSFLSDANEAYKNKEYDKAIEFATKGIEYKESENLYYLLTINSNLANKYNEAIAAAEKGIELTDKAIKNTAKFNFEIAKAYELLSNNSKACEFYKKSYFGPFEAAAKHKVTEELKCN